MQFRVEPLRQAPEEHRGIAQIVVFLYEPRVVLSQFLEFLLAIGEVAGHMAFKTPGGRNRAGDRGDGQRL
jgi:hypothetical protein